jgi:hypothetical protein
MNKKFDENEESFKFAKTILIICFFIMMIGVTSEIIDPKDDVFEKLQDMLQPVISLLIGYFFGKKDN